MKAKDGLTEVGNLASPTRWKTTFLHRGTSALPLPRPVSAGTRIVAPNIAKKCCNDNGSGFKETFQLCPPPL